MRDNNEDHSVSAYEIEQAERSLGSFGNSLKRKIPGLDLTAIFSLADPHIRRSAEALAEKLSETLPKDHWIRGYMVGAALGVLASTVDTASDGKSPLRKALLRKLSFWIQSFARALSEQHSFQVERAVPIHYEWKQKFAERAYQRLSEVSDDEIAERRSHRHRRRRDVEPLASEEWDELKQKFMEDARRRINKASSEQLKEVKAEIKNEAEGLTHLREAIGDNAEEVGASRRFRTEFMEEVSDIFAEASIGRRRRRNRNFHGSGMRESRGNLFDKFNEASLKFMEDSHREISEASPDELEVVKARIKQGAEHVHELRLLILGISSDFDFSF